MYMYVYTMHVTEKLRMLIHCITKKIPKRYKNYCIITVYFVRRKLINNFSLTVSGLGAAVAGTPRAKTKGNGNTWFSVVGGATVEAAPPPAEEVTNPRAVAAFC